MARIDDVTGELRRVPRAWLVTGGAGFIGSHLVEALLALGQEVRVLDNFATGSHANLDDVRACAGAAATRLTVLEGDVVDPAVCAQACRGVSVVLHQAALGSVPRSLADPLATHRANVDGFVQLLLAAKDAGVARFVYASSSSVYGDHPELPKVEDRIGRPLSPYAASKLVDEVYARVYQTSFGVESVGLRYFNVFGPRQDPNGPYAAVIPTWVAALLRGQPCTINGDGETSRDFCAVANAVQANLLAALAPKSATGEVYNVAFGVRTTLRELFALLRDGLARERPELAAVEPVLGPFRAGDVRHSLADIAKARTALGYQPTQDVRSGLAEALPWYVARARG
ncbi:MAG: SDR family oxidoreductase [Deltaproteobacteria bacterium]|nr:SDR family oxidoreductase [Deltaproteobacteria bacterium]